MDDEIPESDLAHEALQSRPESAGAPLRVHWLVLAGIVIVVVMMAWPKSSARVLTRVWAPGGRASAILVEINQPGRAARAYQVCVVSGPTNNASLLPCSPVVGFGTTLPSPESVKFVWRSDTELEVHHPSGAQGHSYAPSVYTARSGRPVVRTRMVED